MRIGADTWSAVLVLVPFLNVEPLRLPPSGGGKRLEQALQLGLRRRVSGI